MVQSILNCRVALNMPDYTRRSSLVVLSSKTLELLASFWPAVVSSTVLLRG